MKSGVRCNAKFRGRPWYDFVMVRKNDAIVPWKVVRVIEVEGMIKFVIHTAIVQDGFDGATTLQNSFCALHS